MDVGPSELLIVLVIALVLFGGAKIPQLARSLGEAQREFRKANDGHVDEPAAPVADALPAPVAEVPAPVVVVAAPVVDPSTPPSTGDTAAPIAPTSGC